MADQISLVPLYLRELIGQSNSFIKSISPGTGLGKTWAAKQAPIEFFEYCRQQKSSIIQICLFTAPMHNQITLTKEGFGEDAEFIKVRPVSPNALSNLESENNAYSIAKELFIAPSGAKRQIFEQLLKAAKKTDEGAKRANPKNTTSYEWLLWGIRKNIRIIDAELKRVPTTESSLDTDDDMPEELASSGDAQYEAQMSAQRLKNNMEDIAKNLVNLSKASYQNTFLWAAIEENLSPQSITQFREVTASFHPFLHIQKSDKQFFFVCMTTAKMMTMSNVFHPRFVSNKGAIEWGPGNYRIDEIVSDRSSLQERFDQCRSNCENANVDPYAAPNGFNSPFAKLYNAEYTLFLDESDEAKTVIAKNLEDTLHDQHLIQAIGAFTKEAGDVVVKNGHEYLVDRIKSNPGQSISDVLTDMQNDDSLHRILSKETLLKVRRKVYQALIDAHWEYAKPYQSAGEMLAAVNGFFQNTLTAPYCAVDKSINSHVFKASCAFSGEMYGFIGSKQLDEMAVVNLGNSFRVIDADKQHHYPPGKAVSAPLFLLMISESYLYFRYIFQSIGSEKANDKQAKIASEIIATDDKQKLADLATKLIKATGSFASISAPFRRDDLHTWVCAATGKQTNRIATGKFKQAFSDQHDLEAVLDSDSALRTPKSAPIDMRYAYEKGHTLYGMVEAYLDYYRLTDDSGHVVFPVAIKTKSPEAFLKSLVDNNARINRIFLLSATGGFENNHVAAFSLSALRILLEETHAQFVNMSPADMELVAAKQAERASAKTICVESVEDQTQSNLTKAVSIELNRAFAPTYEDGKCDHENLKFRLRNRFKRSELDLFLEALEQVSSGKVRSTSVHSFSLALMQTQANILATLKLLANMGAFSFKGQTYSIEVLLLKRESDSVALDGKPSIGSGAGLFVFTKHTKSFNKFNTNKNTDKKTLILCHSAAFERQVAALIRENDGNPKSTSYQLKQLLGLNTKGPVRGSDANDFNVMNYFLNDHHGMNVILASSYMSAGRGINLIVNHESFTKTLNRKSSKPDKHLPQNDLFSQGSAKPTKGPVIDYGKQRDLDALFLCAPPFYSHTRRPEDTSESMDSKAVQARFFHRCQLYHHHLDYLARTHHGKPDDEHVMNTEVDLDSHMESQEVRDYFESQHDISLMATLLQANGRIERTNFPQSQSIYACDGVRQVLKNGKDAIFEGHSDPQIERILSAMSVANERVISALMESPTQATSDISADAIQVCHGLDQQRMLENFEDAKNLILGWIRNYRETVTDNPNGSTVLIEFYEALRSTLIWSDGQQAYIDNLNDKARALPLMLQLKIHRFVESLFFESPQRITDYHVTSASVKGRSSRVFHPNGRAFDPQGRLEEKENLSIENICNPYEEKTAEGYRYPTPWFLSDIDGNFGELILQQAIRKLTKTDPFVKSLDRHNSPQAASAYEYADAFLLMNDKVLAIDAKCLTSRAYFSAASYNDKLTNDKLKAQLESHLASIKTLFPEYRAKIIAVNAASTERSTGDIKRFSEGDDVFTLGAKHSAFEITRQLRNLLKNGYQNEPL